MRAIAALFTLAALTIGLAGCANQNLASEAGDLRGELADLPGVAVAELDYAKPITLDSGKLALQIEMTEDATPDQIVAVTETAYDAFRTTHRGEEADLSVIAGKTTVTLRAFEPDAETSAVSEATRTGLTAAPTGGAATIDLMTQDVSKGDHVSATYVIALPEGSTAEDVPGLLDSLAADHEPSSLIGWGGAAADGSSLKFDKGFPPEQLVSRWLGMQTAGVPLSVRAFEEGSMFAEGNLTTTYDVSKPADRRALDRIAKPQMRAMGAGEWVYDLIDPAGTYVVSVDRYICETAAEGAYNKALEAWAATEFGPCGGA